MVCFIRPVFLLLLFGVSSLAAGLAEAAEPKVFPAVTLSTSGATGAAAVSALGAKLPDVAAFYGKTADELRQQLLSSNALHVARNGRLYTVSPRARRQTAASMAAATFSMSSAAANLGMASASPAAIPLEQTFQLHSKPGAPKTIYLNFIGKTLTPANYFYIEDEGLPTIVVPPLSIDANDLLYSDAERRIIQEIWQRVAEDYAPFDVDVTTEPVLQSRITRTGSDDLVYGTEVLFTRNASEWHNTDEGITQNGAFFDLNDDSGKPSIVFYDLEQPFSTLNPVTPDLADSASREIGVALGLFLAGTRSINDLYPGQGDSPVNGWVPIMGDLSGRPLRQFSKGEYANASSLDELRRPLEKQDDFLVITGRGLPLRADEAGNGTADSTWLPVESSNGRSSASFAGVITSEADKDVFNLKAGVGTLTAQVNPAALGPNADLKLRLLNSQGTQIESKAPPQDLSASISFNITTAGNYFLEVSGTGEGDPEVTGYSSYGSVGGYTLTGSFTTPSNSPPSAIFIFSATAASTPRTITFDASASDDDGKIKSYRWDFGDGTTRDDATPGPLQKTYATVGKYTVTLRVTDDTGLTTQAPPRLVSVTDGSPANDPPVASFSASPLSGTAPLQVTVNGAASTDDDGQIKTYRWEWGDDTSQQGSSPGPVSKTYTMPGTYTITLHVTDDDDVTRSTTRIVTVTAAPVPNKAPVARFEVLPSTIPLTVRFDARTSSDDKGITRYEWDFGDGTTSTTSNTGVFSHTYPQADSYQVTLTVWDADGESASATEAVSIATAPEPNTAPVASFTASKLSGTAPLLVKFNATASWDDKAVTAFEWNFGDGTVDATSNNPQPSHTYTKAGTFPVTLTVRDAENESASVSQDITVVAPPVGDQPKVTVMSVKLAPKGRKLVVARAEIAVVDAAGRPASKAKVTAVWSGPISLAKWGTTRSNGTATFTTPALMSRGCYRLTVTSVTIGSDSFAPSPPVSEEVCR